MVLNCLANQFLFSDKVFLNPLGRQECQKMSIETTFLGHLDTGSDGLVVFVTGTTECVSELGKSYKM